jgi:hypothetical protein
MSRPHGAARRRPPCPDLSQLIDGLIRCADRDPEGFVVSFLEDGTIQIRGPHALAVYPATAWTSKFTRHLHQGFFDTRARAPAEAAAAAAPLVG